VARKPHRASILSGRASPRHSEGRKVQILRGAPFRRDGCRSSRVATTAQGGWALAEARAHEGRRHTRTVLICCTALSRYWHEAAFRAVPMFDRYWRWRGHWARLAVMSIVSD